LKEVKKENYEPEKDGRGRKAQKSKSCGMENKLKMDSLRSFKKNNYEPKTPSRG
jgi:hypothetical protein